MAKSSQKPGSDRSENTNAMENKPVRILIIVNIIYEGY